MATRQAGGGQEVDLQRRLSGIECRSNLEVKARRRARTLSRHSKTQHDKAKSTYQSGGSDSAVAALSRDSAAAATLTAAAATDMGAEHEF